jgi:ABC-2 type transport system permease protein
MPETMLEAPASVETGVRPCPWLAAGTLARRECVRFLRQRNRVFGAIGQPLVLWLLFGVGLGGAFRPAAGSDGTTYLAYFFPGSLVLILLFTAIFATISVIEDRREGFLQSVLVAPIPRWSMVLGKVLGGSLVALAQGLVFLALGWTVGVQFGPLMLLVVVLFLFVVALALTSLGLVLAWRMDSTQGFHAVMSVFLMPMWLLSGAFFPVPEMSSGVSWGAWCLAVAMHANPLTYAVAELRRLTFGEAASAGLPGPVVCWGVTVGFAVVTFLLAVVSASRPVKGDLL